MRIALTTLSAALLLAGCGWEPPGALLAFDAASVVVFGRSLGDIGYSALSGRDCSVVRLDRGQTYCVPRATVRDAYCTRTLATVDCWADPAILPVPQPNVGDTPPPTTAQLRYREAPWPKSLLGMP